MINMLETAEWAVEAPLRMLLNAVPSWWPINHGTPQMRAAVARRVSVSAGINYVAYRRDAYLRLPEGWSCAPWAAGTSDVFMWSKFMADASLSIASSAVSSALKFPSTHGNRGRFTPENRMAEILPWLARLAEPGLVRHLQRTADIHDRMIMLFSVHTAANCDSLDAALEKSGCRAAPAEYEPVAAFGDEQMILPFTEQQREAATDAWMLTRAFDQAFNGKGTCDARSRQILERELSKPVNEMSQTLLPFAYAAPPETALRAYAAIRARFPGYPASYIRPARQLFNAGDFDAAAAQINALEAFIPNSLMVKRIASDIEDARAERQPSD